MFKWLAATLFGPTGERTRRLPDHVLALIDAQEQRSERLIGWGQLILAGTLLALFILAPRPNDAPMISFEPVPVALGAYVLFTLLRIALSYRGHVPGLVVLLSIVIDTALLIGLIWYFHLQYEQPAAFALKVPTFIYIFIFIALRALRFDERMVLAAGLAAASAWLALVLTAIDTDGGGAITSNFVAYVSSNKILLGAEFDKIFTILVVTLVLTIAIWRARMTLTAAVTQQAQSREMSRFLGRGVAETIANSDKRFSAGLAEERDAAIMMLDVRGFTQFSRHAGPRDVVDMLTDLHAHIVPIIQRHNGVVDKFLGDGIMATFGAVKQSDRAVGDALSALTEVIDVSNAWPEELKSRGIDAPLSLNGAIAEGTVVFATLGVSDRLEYTVIGEAANLAARLEKHNKVEKTRGLLTATAYEKALAQGYTPPRKFETRKGCRVRDIAEPISLVIVG